MRTVRRAALSVVLVPLLATPAVAVDKTAKKNACAMTDPANDVHLDDSGPTMSADHLDLRSVEFSINKKEFVAVIKNTASDDKRLGIWKLTFASGKTPLYVLASGGAWERVGDDPDAHPGFRGGVVGGKPSAGLGTLGHDGTVTVRVPLSAFGTAAPRKGTLLSHFAAEAVEKFVTTGTTVVGPVDRAAWPYTFIVGGACRLK